MSQCTCSLLFTTFLAVPGFASGQQDEQPDTKVLERISVTGSRIKRVELEGPAAVITITREDIDERGYTTVYDALRDLPINNGYTAEFAEFQGGGDTNQNSVSPDAQALNLRTFGWGTTLTLLNGRRISNYPGLYNGETTVFSYNSIPVAAVERIEILTTGASAIYGSDAVAGVVNIILRSDINATTLNALWGTPTETKSTRDEWRFQLVNGKTFDKGRYTLTMEYLNRESILGRDYDQYDNQKEDYPFGEGLYRTNTFTADYFVALFTLDDFLRDPGEIFGTSGQAACDRSENDAIYAYRPGWGYYCAIPGDGAPSINFRNAHESYSVYFNGVLEVGSKGTEIWTDLLYYNARSSNYSARTGFVEEILDLTAPDSLGLGYPDWYLAARGLTAGDLGMNLGWAFDDEAWTAVVGGNGYFGRTQEWEGSISWSRQNHRQSVPWPKWREVIDNVLGSHLGVSFAGNDWWSGGTLGEELDFPLGDPATLYGPVNQAVIDTIGVQTYTNQSTDVFLNLTLRGDLWELPAGPLSYAAIVEYEKQQIDYVPDQLITQKPPTTDATGATITNTLTGSGWYRLTGYEGKGNRNRWSTGLELRVPLVRTLALNLAARYDHYDSTSTSFGGDTTPSASIEWRPVEQLLVRAGYTQSFRAPDLAVVFTSSGTYTGAIDTVGCYQRYVFVTGSSAGFDPQQDCGFNRLFIQNVGPQEIGLPALDAETGDNYWVGFSWDITDNLSLTVDYTQLTLENRVQDQTVQSLLDDDWACFNDNPPSDTSCEQVGVQIVRGQDPLTGVSFIDEFFLTSVNQYEDRGKFLDIELVYSLNTDFGLFRFNGYYSNMLQRELRLTPDAQPIDLRNGLLAEGFRSSFTGIVAWSLADFSTAVTVNYRGSTPKYFCSDLPSECIGQETGEDYYATGNTRVDSYTTVNLVATYYWTDQFLTRLRVLNLFNEPPPWDDTFFRFSQPWYNANFYSGAGIGRYAAIEMEYTF